MTTLLPREEPPYVVNHNLTEQKPAESREFDLPPLVRLQAEVEIALRLELAQTAQALRVLEFIERVEEETKGGVTGADMNSRVSGTRSAKYPKLDRNDEDFIKHRADYRGHLKDALKSLGKCQALEKKVLLPKHEATPDERRITSDDPSCENCSAVRPFGKKKPWRIRAGRCIPCYQYWLSSGRTKDRPKDLWAR